jgi:hypothetical protein
MQGGEGCDESCQNGEKGGAGFGDGRNRTGGASGTRSGANSWGRSAEVGAPGVVVGPRVGRAEAVAPDDVVGGIDGAVEVEGASKLLRYCKQML